MGTPTSESAAPSIGSARSESRCSSACDASRSTDLSRKSDDSGSMGSEGKAGACLGANSPRSSRQSTSSPESSLASSTSSSGITALHTPPSSTTDKFSAHERQTSNSVSGSRIGKNYSSFSSRRRAKPASLDVDALRRERQFTGPYSSNPLLSRTRSGDGSSADQSAADQSAVERLDSGIGQPADDLGGLATNSARCEPGDYYSSPQALDSPLKRIRLPQIMSGPFAALGSYSFSAIPRSLSSSVATPTSDHARASSHPVSVPRSAAPAPKNNDSASRDSASGQHASTPLENVMDKKRARFLELCGEIWDLVNDQK